MVSKEIPMQCVSFGFRNRTKHEDPNLKWLCLKKVQSNKPGIPALANRHVLKDALTIR